jgi:hypothetical protein
MSSPVTVTRRVAVSVAVAVLAATIAAARATSGDTAASARFIVLAHADPGDAYAGDVYGHRDYAYLSSHRGRRACPAQGVRVYDVRDPRRPRLVARFASVAGTWTEKTIVQRVATPRFRGDLAVTSFQNCRVDGFRGFGLYDVTNPRRPRRLALVRTAPRGSHEIWLGSAGNRAYVYTAIISSEIRSAPDYDPQRHQASSPGKPDFRIFDVSDPRRPRQVGEWGAWKTLGIHPNDGLGTGRLNQNLVHSVITNRAGTRAFLSYWDLGTVLLDITQPARPRYLGRTRFEPGEVGNAHSAALGRDETLLVETHETDGGTPTFFDISNPAAPVRLSELELPEALLRQGRRGQDFDRVSGLDLADSVHDPKVFGETAFFSWYRQGVVAADISDPRRPGVVARFLPAAARDRESLICPGRSCRSVWGVFVTPRYVLASDMLSGLWVLRFTSR